MAAGPEETLFVSTTPGLEPALERESRGLGFDTQREEGGVRLCGPVGLHQDANLWLRTASRVLLRLATFEADDARSLERQLAAVSLARFGTRPVAVRVVEHGSRVGNPTAIEQWARRTWQLGPAPATEDAQEVLIRLEGRRCVVSADTTGTLLHVRGYRQEVGRAPLRETLAAGLLGIAGFDGTRPLWDLMCGSGTIAVEGAGIAARQPPGAHRTFAFESWAAHDAQAWQRRKETALGKMHRPAHPIWATDLNAGALGTARRNARRAGVLEFLRLERADATRATPAELEPGWVASNLPYGKRVGARFELEPLYAALGENLRRHFLGWRYALLVEDERADQWLRLQPTQGVRLKNGGLTCWLLLGQL